MGGAGSPKLRGTRTRCHICPHMLEAVQVLACTRRRMAQAGSQHYCRTVEYSLGRVWRSSLRYVGFNAWAPARK